MFIHLLLSQRLNDSNTSNPYLNLTTNVRIKRTTILRSVPLFQYNLGIFLIPYSLVKIYVSIIPYFTGMRTRIHSQNARTLVGSVQKG